MQFKYSDLREYIFSEFSVEIEDDLGIILVSVQEDVSMKIITYSDLHLEFGTDFMPPEDSDADVLVLAGDIITFRDFEPLNSFINGWHKPVIFIAGNHEFYTNKDMHMEAVKFQEWITAAHPNVHFLQDEAITIDGVNFFGGTMWTDFQNGSEKAMLEAKAQMNDFKLIKTGDGISLTPQYTTKLHSQFVEKMLQWFQQPLSGNRVVITHHAPVINPATKFTGSMLTPAFNSTDMIGIIDQHQPALWIYGHTHECDDHNRENTRIISNQRGYQFRRGQYECEDTFDPAGKSIDID